MPADLVRNEAIPQLATQINSPAMLRVLRLLREVGFIQNSGNLDRRTFDTLQRLAALGLADPGYAGPTNGTPFIWVSNPNGERVLRHIETLPADAQAPLESGVKIHPRARTALAALSARDYLAVLAAAEALQAGDPASWSKEETVRLGEDKPVYLLRVPPDLGAFIRVLDSGGIELFDIVREETLQLFLDRQRAASTPQ